MAADRSRLSSQPPPSLITYQAGRVDCLVCQPTASGSQKQWRKPYFSHKSSCCFSFDYIFAHNGRVAVEIALLAINL